MITSIFLSLLTDVLSVRSDDKILHPADDFLFPAHTTGSQLP